MRHSEALRGIPVTFTHLQSLLARVSEPLPHTKKQARPPRATPPTRPEARQPKATPPTQPEARPPFFDPHSQPNVLTTLQQYRPFWYNIICCLRFEGIKPS